MNRAFLSSFSVEFFCNQTCHLIKFLFPEKKIDAFALPYRRKNYKKNRENLTRGFSAVTHFIKSR